MTQTIAHKKSHRSTGHSPLSKSFRSASVWAMVALCPLGCAPTESELFADSRLDLAEGLGETCDLGVEGFTVELQNGHPDCENDLACLAVGADAAKNLGVEVFDPVCTCPCDGPEGLGPYCTCFPGFVCMEVFEDLGLSRKAQSYCVPE